MSRAAGYVKEFLNNQYELDFGGAWFAIFSRDITDLSEPAYVYIPGFDNIHVWGPCRWQTRDATSLPQRGDRALAIRDDRQQWWVIAWWPFDETISGPVDSGSGPTPDPTPGKPITPTTDATWLTTVGGVKVEHLPITGTGKGGGANATVNPALKRGVIHDTEGFGSYDATRDYMASQYPPNFTIGVDGGNPRITQFFPLGKSSDATIDHDFEIWCQIEIMTPVGAAMEWSTHEWRSWLAPMKNALEALMTAVGVPMVNQSNFASRGANWANAGWFGHCDVPDNYHQDPGPNFPWSDYL